VTPFRVLLHSVQITEPDGRTLQMSDTARSSRYEIPAMSTIKAARAGKRECQHRPRCPDALAPGRSAARIVANHPGQGWNLLCNGVVLFDDGGALLPDGRAVAPDTAGPARTAA
jgi:Family of unknown function (DUF5999)